MSLTNPTLPTDDQIIHGCVDEETAYVVDDYPYGRQRTQIRYWVESVKNKGDRFVSQTLNPKTGRWNKPKKSTYSTLRIMFLEEQEDGRLFVKAAGVGSYCDSEVVRAALDLIVPNEVQKMECARLIGMNKVMEHVTFTVREGEATEAEKAEQVVIKHRINRAIAVETHTTHQEL